MFIASLRPSGLWSLLINSLSAHLSVLDVSPVNSLRESTHRRATEHAEGAQRGAECELALSPTDSLRAGSSEFRSKLVVVQNQLCTV
jgi:hypothetical protein